MSFYDDASLLTICTAYKSGKLYSVKPDDGTGDFTFSRSTTGTRINESGLIESVGVNVPRIDYSSGVPSLLLEPKRTNLIDYSEDFNTWQKTFVNVSTNATILPDGTQNKPTKLVETNDNTFHFVQKGMTLSSGAVSFTFYAKAAERTSVSSFLSQNGNFGGVFDLTNITATATGTGNTAFIESVGNGWYKCTTINDGNNTINGFVRIGIQNGALTSYQGDGVSGVYIWGAQVEEASYPTSYIPTYGTIVTRLADEIELLQLSSYFPNLSKGTIFFEFEDKGHRGTGSSVRFIFRNSVGGSQLAFITRTDGFLFYDYNSQNYLITSGTQVGQTYKFAVTFNDKIAVGFANGLKENTQTSVNDFEINEWIFTSLIHNSLSFKNIMFFPTALTDAECITLTTI